MFIQTTLTNKRPGGKGKGVTNTYTRPMQQLPRVPVDIGPRAVSPSRTEELCPDDWLAGERENEVQELDEIIRLMDERAKEIVEDVVVE